jgi:coenzyme F420 hydrogenase subunit beta
VEALHKLDALDRRIATRSLERPFDPSAPLFIDFAEHVDHYAGTDRAPVVRDR